MPLMDDDKRAKLLVEPPKIHVEDARVLGSDRLDMTLELDVKRLMAKGVPVSMIVRRVCRDCNCQWVAIKGQPDDHLQRCFIRSGEYL